MLPARTSRAVRALAVVALMVTANPVLAAENEGRERPTISSVVLGMITGALEGLRPGVTGANEDRTKTEGGDSDGTGHHDEQPPTLDPVSAIPDPSG